MLRATETALANLGPVTEHSSCQIRDLVQMLLDQKQGCLMQLRETRPLDRRMNELLRLEKRQRKELDEFKDLLGEAKATLERIQLQRISKSRELAITRKELTRLYSQLPAACESPNLEMDGVLQDPYTELYDLEMLDCTTDQTSHAATPSVRLVDLTAPPADGGITPKGAEPTVPPRLPREVLLADAAVLGFDLVNPADIPVTSPLDDAILAACFESAQQPGSGMPTAAQQPAQPAVAARPFRLAKGRSSPYRADEGKDKDA